MKKFTSTTKNLLYEYGFISYCLSRFIYYKIRKYLDIFTLLWAIENFLCIVLSWETKSCRLYYVYIFPKNVFENISKLTAVALTLKHYF